MRAVLSAVVEQPYPEWPPTGLHFNHSLWSTKKDENAMYDANQPDSLSDVVRWWVAGLLKHASSLMALCCPTVNCYRRLGGCFAPTFADWAIDDRNATIRVKNYGPKVNYFGLVFAVHSCSCYVHCAALQMRPNCLLGLHSAVRRPCSSDLGLYTCNL